VDATGKNMIQTNQSQQVMISTDSGSTWTNRGLGGYGMAGDVSSGGTIFYFTNSGWYQVRRSTDAGSTWNSGGCPTINPTDLKCSDDGLRVYVPCWSSGAVWYSWDAGSTYYQSNAPSVAYNGVWCTPNGSIVYVGAANGSVYKSTDCGSTYSPTNAPVGSCIGISCDATGSKAIYINKTIGSVYRTSDGGSTWTGIFPINATDGRGGAISYNGSVAHIPNYSTGSVSTTTNWNYPFVWTSGAEIQSNLTENWSQLKDNWDLIGWTKHFAAGSLTVTLSSDSDFTNYNSYTIVIGSSWTLNSIDLGSPTASGGAIDWNNIQKVKFSISNGSAIVQDWAIGAVANS
jgi:photosystem II stability/assembly factor-like uncharacterized protein